jgi:prepilin peptidase CpaA
LTPSARFTPISENQAVVEFQPFPSAVIVATASVAAVTDLWKFKVYNALTVPVLLSGLVYHGIVGGWSGLGLSLLGMLCGFGVLFFFFLLGGYGGGDVKLLAATGAWLGAEATLYIFLASSIAAAIYALALVVYYGKLGEVWLRFKIIGHRFLAMGRHLSTDDGLCVEENRIDRRRAVPFAAMMCIGVIVTLVIWWAAHTP